MKNKINIIIVFFFFIGFASIQAQISAGAGLAYGFEVEEIGVQIRGAYRVNDTWRGETDYTYYLDGTENVSFWELNLNGNYIFFDNGSAKAYALAGLNFFHVNLDLVFADGSTTETGFNLGAGGELGISDRLKGFAELKYAISDADQLLLAAGVLFNL